MPIICSPLNRTVSRNGKSVEVEIYRAENEEWILEVIDEYGNSTVWNDPFPTDQAALDEATRAIDEDGIDAMIGPDERNLTLICALKTALRAPGRKAMPSDGSRR